MKNALEALNQTYAKIEKQIFLYKSKCIEATCLFELNRFKARILYTCGRWC